VDRLAWGYLEDRLEGVVPAVMDVLAVNRVLGVAVHRRLLVFFR